MDFFERQAIAHRNTRWLVAYFALAVIGTVLAIHFCIALALTLEKSRSYDYDGNSPSVFWDPELLAAVSIGTLSVILCGSLYKISQLSSGGSAVAEMLGGRPVSAGTTDPLERKLLNVVEEMAIASGTPVPQVYVLPNENGINAFAAGHSTGDMVICVTMGALSLLTRDELQGVIGHEFSHILNGDMRLNLRLMGFVFGILCLTVIGRILLRVRSSSRDGKGGNPLPLLGLLLFIIGYVGVFFARLIKSAVSRQREFLADASSVQFTRNPSGLAGALKKAAVHGSVVDDPNAEDASHFFFSNGMHESFVSWMSTHPPLEERIRELEPTWDGKLLPIRELSATEANNTATAKPVFPPQLASALGVKTVTANTPLGAVLTAGVLASVGTATPQHLDYASDIVSKIPGPLSAAARDPMGAAALVYALLLGADEKKRDAQLQSLETETAMRDEIQRLLPSLNGLEGRARLPLVTLAMTALRGLSPAQYAEFTKNMESLVQSDGQIDLFEYMLQKMAQRQLDSHFNPAKKTVVQYYAIKQLLPDCAVLLSALANSGQDTPEAVLAAYLRGAQELPFESKDLKPFDPAACGLTEIDTALSRLNLASPSVKKLALNACAETVAADGAIQQNEAELLRAIADALDCPIPPFLVI